MRYLDALIEMTDDQKALKNRIMGRTSRGQMLTPGKHSTGGSERGEKKVKGEKPEPSKHRDGRLLRSKKGPNPKKGHIAADDLVKDFTAGPQGKLPEHTEYKRMALMMAEALGLREEDNPTETDVAQANKDVHTKKGVKGETAKETKAVDKEIDKAMGPAKKGAAGGIDAMKAKIRAAGEATRGK